MRIPSANLQGRVKEEQKDWQRGRELTCAGWWSVVEVLMVDGGATGGERKSVSQRLGAVVGRKGFEETMRLRDNAT